MNELQRLYTNVLHLISNTKKVILLTNHSCSFKGDITIEDNNNFNNNVVKREFNPV